MGHVHAENLANNILETELYAVADVNTSAAQEVSNKLGVTRIFGDYRELLEVKEIDAVAIVVPTFWKHQIILDALESGKHIFCEKPLALSLEQADKIVAEVENSGLKFQVGYMRRFDNSHLRAKTAIDGGAVGKIMYVISRSRELLIGRPAPTLPVHIKGWFADPKLGGSSLLDITSHDFDVVRWLGDCEIVRVYTEAAALAYDYEDAGPMENFDNAIITLKLSNGAIGYVDMCIYNVYGYDVSAEVLGTKGAVTVSSGERTSARVLRNESIENEFPNSSEMRFGQAYRDELIEFARSVINGRTTRVSARDGRAALAIALAARQSAKESRPIDVKNSP